MGEKGSKLGQEAAKTCEEVVRMLGPTGDVRSRKMFGGYGIFEEDTMFGLVNSDGEFFLKADDSNRSRFVEAGMKRHGKMPYFQVPAEVMGDSDLLEEWAGESIEIARAAKKK